MTAGEIIAKTDELEPNQYSTELKLGWLSNLDGKIYEAVIKTHEPERVHHRPWPNPLEREHRTKIPIHHMVVAKPHEKPEEEEERPDADKRPVPIWPYTEPKARLIIPEPYAEDIYCHYLQAKIASENAETVKYNQQITLFNSAYDEWVNLYNRTHMPKQARGGNRWRY